MNWENENYKDYTIFYHEDDYGQVELLPIEDIPYIQNEIEQIDNCHQENGFSQIHLREIPQYGLKIREIPTAEIESIFAKLYLTRHTEVATGYGSSFRIRSKDTIGFGDGYKAIFYIHHLEKVFYLWLSSPELIDNKNLLVATLLELGHTYKLILVDWSYRKMINLQDENEIINYLYNED